MHLFVCVSIITTSNFVKITVHVKVCLNVTANHAHKISLTNLNVNIALTVLTAGSLGHGTGVFGNFDVDLVIYSDGKHLIVCMCALLYSKCINDCVQM